MNLLLDTHIWLWYALGDSALPKSLEKIISSKATKLWVSPISMWEIMILVDKEKISLDQDAAAWIKDSLSMLAIHEAPISGQIAILSGSSGSMVISFANQKNRLASAYGNFQSLQIHRLDV